jgi:hypothetical protein
VRYILLDNVLIKKNKPMETSVHDTSKNINNNVPVTPHVASVNSNVAVVADPRRRALNKVITQSQQQTQQVAMDESQPVVVVAAAAVVQVSLFITLQNLLLITLL